MTIPEQKTNWNKNWKNEKIGFHQAQTSPSLLQYAHILDEERTILVPLCGKTLDMHFLHQRNHCVIGVELIPKAIDDFFQEWGVVPTKKKDRFWYEQITIINQNIFAIQPPTIPTIDGIFDRAALVALPTHIRAQYARHLLTLLKDEGTLLLITYDLPRSQEKGPPFAVRQNDVPKLFARASSVELLKEIHKTPKEEPSLSSRGVAWSKEHVWLIRK